VIRGGDEVRRLGRWCDMMAGVPPHCQAVVLSTVAVAVELGLLGAVASTGIEA
jgi:hypothetical protein